MLKKPRQLFKAPCAQSPSGSKSPLEQKTSKPSLGGNQNEKVQWSPHHCANYQLMSKERAAREEVLKEMGGLGAIPPPPRGLATSVLSAQCGCA